MLYQEWEFSRTGRKSEKYWKKEKWQTLKKKMSIFPDGKYTNSLPNYVSRAFHLHLPSFGWVNLYGNDITLLPLSCSHYTLWKNWTVADIFLSGFLQKWVKHCFLLYLLSLPDTPALEFSRYIIRGGGISGLPDWIHCAWRRAPAIVQWIIYKRPKWSKDKNYLK